MPEADVLMPVVKITCGVSTFSSMKTDFVNIHCHSFDPGIKISVQNQYIDTRLNLTPDKVQSSFKSIGIHPWFTSESVFAAQWKRLLEKIEEEEYFAIGECGLDRLKGPSLSFQEQVLAKHCQLAEKSGKPVILHLVKSYSDILGFQKKYRFGIAMIIHGFSGNSREAEKLTDAGFYLSFGVPLLKDSEKLSQALALCPGNQLFLETDTSKTPVSEVYEKAARLKAISLTDLSLQIKKNFDRIS